MGSLNDLARQIHTDNYRWWHDLHTDERLVRNKGELIALMHSEISEAHDALVSESNDDKLPHLPGEHVEIADFAIRVFDYAGAYGFDLDDGAVLPHFVEHNVGIMLLELHSATSALLEATRKDQPEAKLVQRMIRLAYLYANIRSFDLDQVIAEKRAFNATRKDHTKEARLAAGGKKF